KESAAYLIWKGDRRISRNNTAWV
ncbi:hypothetical protein HKBW3S42_01505, partial [Candidatus Hakubella thermalkaliphila]